MFRLLFFGAANNNSWVINYLENERKEQAVIERLFIFFLSDAVAFSQISKLTILLRQENEFLSEVFMLEL